MSAKGKLTAELWRRVEPILDHALGLSGDEQRAYVEETCAGDAELLEVVVRLVGADADAEGRFPESIGGAVAESDVTASVPESVAGYRVLRVLGQGGMGVVYLGEQSEPIHRQVAIKLLRPGMDTAQVIARFEAERQALAVMDHPSIARIIDAGATAEGRPYFVMEYVDGLPITEYCDRNQLSTRHRLELFRRLCAGVQHAHHKAVIHRDLKPSNVLVAEHDGIPVPRIIDFGIAKATGGRWSDRSPVTEHGLLIGTLEYMSPEQADPGGATVDTRADVYSLGAMLYELLTGTRPFEPGELRHAAVAEVLRKILDDDPPRPSERLSTLGGLSADLAVKRRTTAPHLRRELSGDLDWITLCALEKNRDRRYGSPEALSADIGRYLADEPVTARPPSAAYRARKFVRRHRFGVIVASAILGGLVLAVAGLGVSLARVRRAEAAATREAAAKSEVAAFLIGLFQASDPREARGAPLTADELLQRGAERIRDEFGDQPELQSELLEILGRVYMSKGLYSDAESLLDDALRVRREVLDLDNERVVELKGALAGVYWYQGRFEEAMVAVTEARDLETRLTGGDTVPAYTAMHTMALLHYSRGQFEAAISAGEEALDGLRRLRGAEDPKTLTAMATLSAALRQAGRVEDAARLGLEAYEIRKRTLGPDHPETLRSANNVAIAYREEGRLEEALALHQETLAIKIRVLGESHIDTVSSRTNVGLALLDLGRLEEAEQMLTLALRIQSEERGLDHPATLEPRFSLANTLKAMGRLDEAEAHYIAILELARRISPTHSAIGSTLYEWAGLEIARGRFPAALDHLQELVDAGWGLDPDDPALGPLHGEPRFEAMIGS